MLMRLSGISTQKKNSAQTDTTCTVYSRGSISINDTSACSGGAGSGYVYVAQVGASPAIGEIVYTDSGCRTTPFAGSNGWYNLDDGASVDIAAQIDNNGEILDITVCP